MSIDVSAPIPTRNHASSLRTPLAAMDRACREPLSEPSVGENRSTGATGTIVHEFGSRLQRLCTMELGQPHSGGSAPIDAPRAQVRHRIEAERMTTASLNRRVNLLGRGLVRVKGPLARELLRQSLGAGRLRFDRLGLAVSPVGSAPAWSSTRKDAACTSCRIPPCSGHASKPSARRCQHQRIVEPTQRSCAPESQ